jgi:peroxiredoxin
MKIPPVIFFLLINKIAAQQSTAVPLFENLNQKIAAIPNGYFECKYIRKSLMKDDTTSNAGRTYFFKSESDKDSIGKFLIEMPYNTRKAYDGKLFYQINDSSGYILANAVSEKGGVKKFLSGGIQSELAFRNFIYGDVRPAFLLEMFENAAVDTISEKTRKYIRVTRTYTSINPLKVTEKDPQWTQIRQELEWSLPDLNLQFKREWVHIGERFQFLEQQLSPIHALPDSVTFERLLNLDSLLLAGYRMESSKQKLVPALVRVGDTLPIFRLPDLDSVMVSNTDLDKGLILLDFWYKGCAPCLLGMPTIERLYQTYKGRGLQVYGINGHDKVPEKLKALQKEFEVNYPTLLDSEKSLARHLQVTGYPTVILADAQTRKILFAKAGLGQAEADAIIQILEEQLK